MSKFKISLLLFVFNLGFSQNESLKTEIWEPVPEKIDAYNFNKAPSDAIVLFDGSDFSSWIGQYSNKTPEWKINKDGSMTVINGTGGIKLKNPLVQYNYT
jgi:hypothetical protein